MKRKFLSTILSCTIVFSLVPQVMSNAYAASWTARENEVDLRVGLFGDSHITNSDSVESPLHDEGIYWMKEAIVAHKELGANKLDGLVLTGDIIYQTSANYTNHYDQLNILLKEYGENFPYLFAMGNHEYVMNGHQVADPAASALESQTIFKDKTGLDLQQHKVISGYDFFAVAPTRYDCVYSDETQQWLMREIDKVLSATSTNANPDGTFADGVVPNSTKPVFFTAHHPVDGTFDNYQNAYAPQSFNETFRAWLKNRPQIINFAAHIHTATERPHSISQDGFTSFHTPNTAYGKTNVGAVTDTNIFTHHGSMVEVKNNIVSIIRYDLKNKRYIGEPWTIDVPKIVADMTDDNPDNNYDHQLYSNDKRENTLPPVWDKDAKITILKRSNGAVISFPNSATAQKTPNQQDDFVLAYRVELKDTDGRVILDETYANDYWNIPQQTIVSRPVSALGYGNTYTVNVYPVNPFYVEGAPISTTFTTRAESISTQSQRFEAEDYIAATNRTATATAYASGGKIYHSADGNVIPGYKGTFTTSNGDEPSFQFNVTIPKNDTYTVEWVGGYNTNTSNLSKVTLSLVDKNNVETLIGTNNSSSYIYDDMSIGGNYPSKYIPFKKMRNSLEIAAGEYTVKVNIATCQTTRYMFALDYIQFTPTTFEAPDGEMPSSLIRDKNGVIEGVAISSGSLNSEGDITEVGSLSNIIDGEWEGKNANDQWYSKWNQSSPYVQIDLGKPKHISQIIYRPFNNVNTGGSYWRNKFEILASNYADFRDYEVLAVQEDEIPIETNYTLNTDPTITKYRFVRVARCASIADKTMGAREIDVIGYEGEDTTIATDLVKSTSITNGTNGLTNVKNAKAVNPWGSAGAKTKTYQDGKPIEIQFTDDTDMTLVNTSTVKLSKFDGTSLSAVAYTPAIDTKNKTLKIDLSQLEPFVGSLSNTGLENMYYQLDITSGIMTEDSTFCANPVSIKFTTNQIAKVPYIEGKEIKNVAMGKSARFKKYDGRTYNNSTGLGAYYTGYTNGATNTTASTTDTTTGTEIREGNTTARVLTVDNPVLIDLGAKYQIVGLAFVTDKYVYHYRYINHYLTNTPTYDSSNLTSAWDTQKMNTFVNSVTITPNEPTRYMLVKAYQESEFPQEIMAYAYVDAGADNDIYFTSPVSAYTAKTEDTPYSETVTITANAENCGTSVLILAEYEGDKMTGMVKSAICENGKASLSIPKTNGKTYKAFLWNSLFDMTPIREAIEF